MAQPGYQGGAEALWWWKVAQHLDEAQRALANAMAHNLDDQGAVFGLQDKFREVQAILLSIFQVKGLISTGTAGSQTAGSPVLVEVPVDLTGQVVPSKGED